jgi:hypothetical protein
MISAEIIAEEYMDNYGVDASIRLKEKIQSMSFQFDTMGYTSQELYEHKQLKQALKIIQDHE